MNRVTLHPPEVLTTVASLRGLGGIPASATGRVVAHSSLREVTDLVEVRAVGDRSPASGATFGVI